MCRVRVWGLESANDTMVAKQIAEQLKGEHITIRAVPSRRIPTPRKRRGNATRKEKEINREEIVRNYLQQDDYVILVIDSDNYATEQKRLSERNSLRNQAEQIARLPEFDGKVFLAIAVMEIEAWLLTDCLGIFHYFAGQRPATRTRSRDQIAQNKKYKQVINKYQRGDTEKIVGAEQGKGGDAKAHLVDFSKAILMAINPQMPRKNIDNNKYGEGISSKIAEHIQLGSAEIRRNRSLDHFRGIMQTITQLCQEK